MQDLIDYALRHWVSISLLLGLSVAVWYVLKNKEKLFYNKPNAK